MLTQQPLLSKTLFVSGSQCPLRLWNDTYQPERATELSFVQQAILEEGRRVGELARKRHPEGRLVDQDHEHMEEALQETLHALESDTYPALFEAAFEHQGVLARPDIIERLPEGGWRLIEVKSATKVKEAHIQDAAIQAWVLLGAGLDVRDVSVLTLNRDYVYDGQHLDLQDLFCCHSLMHEVSERQESLGDRVESMLSMLAENDAPHIEPGDHCFKPNLCAYYEHCTRNMQVTEHPIGELPRLGAAVRARLRSSNILRVTEIPDDFPLSRLQSIVRQSVKEKRDIIHGDIQGELSKLTAPVHHLDFETFAPVVPRFAGTGPFGQIPFLFSVHREDDDDLTHVDYLHESESDPCARLASELVAALGKKGSICTYMDYESQVLANLSKAVPELADALRAIQERLFDLKKLLETTYYHPRFHGSFSLKRVLPVLCDIKYDDLEIRDGLAAAHQYMQALDETDPQKRRETLRNLRGYCKRDTLATVQVKRALANIEK